jgi:hypothetical protein
LLKKVFLRKGSLPDPESEEHFLLMNNSIISFWPQQQIIQAQLKATQTISRLFFSEWRIASFVIFITFDHSFPSDMKS